MPSNHLIFCRPLLGLHSIFPSIRVFSNESALRIRWPKYWSFSFSVNPSNEYSGLISFRIYWLDLLAVQETPKSLLQCHSSKTSILWCSVFFIVQLSHSCMTTGKTIALTTWTFVHKIMSFLKICIETNENENTTQNLWDTVKAVLRGGFIAIQAYLKKQEKNLVEVSWWLMV